MGAIRRSLKLKFTLIILLLLALTVGVAPWGAIKMQESQLLAASAERLVALDRMVETIASMYMVSEDRHSVQEKLEATRSHPDIQRLRILTPDGVIRFSSYREEVGQRVSNTDLAQYVGRIDPLVQGTQEGTTHTLVRPVFNRQQCFSCHADGQKVLGLVQVTLSLTPVLEQLGRLRESAIAATLITLGVVALGIWLSLSTLVDQPIQKLIDVVARVEGGDLTARTDVTSNDEIGQLGSRLNEMISELESAQQKLNDYHQEQLARADRLASIGKMAAAIAHEIRNPLTGIRGVLSVMAREFPKDDQRHEIVRQTNQLIDRLNKSVEDILHYSRPSHPRLSSVCLDDVVKPVLSLVEGEAHKTGVDLIMESPNGAASPVVRVDPQQIQQVLVNLVLNAIHATPAGGRIWIRLAAADPAHGGKVVLEVEDTGKGMTEEEAENAFQPFFSTKAQGTGLGLPIAKQIVEQHQGRLLVTSAPGHGTRVRLELPAGEGEAEVEAGAEPHA